jgi:hypothetical protein
MEPTSSPVGRDRIRSGGKASGKDWLGLAGREAGDPKNAVAIRHQRPGLTRPDDDTVRDADGSELPSSHQPVLPGGEVGNRSLQRSLHTHSIA